MLLLAAGGVRDGRLWLLLLEVVAEHVAVRRVGVGVIGGGAAISSAFLPLRLRACRGVGQGDVAEDLQRLVVLLLLGCSRSRGCSALHSLLQLLLLLLLLLLLCSLVLLLGLHGRSRCSVLLLLLLHLLLLVLLLLIVGAFLSLGLVTLIQYRLLLLVLAANDISGGGWRLRLLLGWLRHDRLEVGGHDWLLLLLLVRLPVCTLGSGVWSLLQATVVVRVERLLLLVELLLLLLLLGGGLDLLLLVRCRYRLLLGLALAAA